MKNDLRLTCCQKFCCFMWGSFLSVLSVIIIAVVATWLILKRDPIFKSEHKAPDFTFSGY